MERTKPSYKTSEDYKLQLINGHKAQEPFLFQKWFPKLKHLLQKTIILDLSKEEAQAILDYQDDFYKEKHYFTNKSKETISNLEEKLNSVIKENFKQGCFIKFSFRSPKDGFPLGGQNLKELFDEEVKQKQTKWNQKNWPVELSKTDFDSNINWIAYSRVLEQSLKCSSGEEALNIILSSTRAYEDLTSAIDYDDLGERKEFEWSMKIILREWVDEINGLYEYRCIVRDDKMVAITQYNHPFLIEELFDVWYREDVRKLMYDYWNANLKEVLKGYPDYVVDFCVVGKNVHFIEINPLSTSGLGLFNWKEDKELLEGPTKECVSLAEIDFRVRMDDYVTYTDQWENMYKLMFEEIVNSKSYKINLEQL
jgi:hypothetical protein